MLAQQNKPFRLVAEQPVNPTEERVLPFQFTGDASEYFRIWIVNVGLSIVTLGIYSAWAKVRTKRYFYRHTILDGSSFDYLARPESVLKGRILVGTLIAATAAAGQFSKELYAVLSVLLLLLTPAFVVLGAAFNARNSAYRNVRFAFRAGIGAGYAQFAAAGAIYLLTLFTGFPYAQWRITKFLLQSHTYGLEPFEFHAPAKAFFRAYLKSVLVVVLAVFCVAMPGGFLLNTKDNLLLEVAGGAVLGIGISAAYLLGFAHLRAALNNAIFGGLTIGPHALESDQRATDLAKLYLVNALAITFSLGLLIPWAMIRTVRYRFEHLRLRQRGSLVTENNELAGAVGPVGDAAADLGGMDFDLGF